MRVKWQELSLDALWEGLSLQPFCSGSIRGARPLNLSILNLGRRHGRVSKWWCFRLLIHLLSLYQMRLRLFYCLRQIRL